MSVCEVIVKVVVTRTSHTNSHRVRLKYFLYNKRKSTFYQHSKFQKNLAKTITVRYRLSFIGAVSFFGAKKKSALLRCIY